MFNLEQSIAEWRQHMLAAGIKSPVPLEELESHLREEIELQMKSGIQAQTAFLNATGKIGRGEHLREQFKQAYKMDKSKQRKFIGYFYSSLLILYVLATTYAMTRNDLAVSDWYLGMAAQVTLLLLSLLCWRQMPARFPTIKNRVLQSMVGLIGGISGAAWFLAFAYFILPHYNFTTGELVVAILWAMIPTLILQEMAFMLLDKSEGEEPQINRETWIKA
jgi:Na+/proline symporter